MSYPVYQVPAGDVLPIFFDTFAGSTGASITMSGLAVTDIEVYKDGNPTQRASDAGFTLLDTDGIDFDGITGIHGFSIDTGNNSDSGFYTVGAWFHVVVSAVTIDGQSVSFVAAAFRIMAAENSAGVPAADVTSMQAGTVTASALATDAVDEIVDAVWDEVLTAATHNVANSAGRRLRQVRSALYSGTAQAGAATSITLDAGAPATDNIFQGEIVSITGGTGLGQTRSIVNYVGSTKIATVDRAWVTNPDNTSTFEIVGTDERNILQDGKAAAGGASSITLSAGASATDDVYNGLTIFLSAGTGAQQARLVTDYNGTTKVATVAPAWTVQPDATSIYQIMPVGQVIVESLNGTVEADLVDAVWDEPTSGHAIAGSTGEVIGALGSMIENTSDGWIYTVAALQQAAGGGLDAAGVRAAIGLSSANLDAQLDALPTAAENAAAVMGSTIEGTFDLTESARLWNAALAGKASGLATTTATFRDLADTKDRITATVDADGNRTAVTRDVT